MIRFFCITILVFWMFPFSVLADEFAKHRPFFWNRDALWLQLEQQFVEARANGCNRLAPEIAARILDLNASAVGLASQPLPPGDPKWDDAEQKMLSLAPLMAACPHRLDVYIETVMRLRAGVKYQAKAWPAQAAETRRRLYGFIYGGRTAIEEILLQDSSHRAPALWQAAPVPSVSPSIKIHGVTLYSGDMLVSRGGSAISALIARGSDYPGNFSHVSLLHVDEATGDGSVIEALIEYGVQVNTIPEYLKDKKFRIMVLRLRPDLPAVVGNPTIAHQAAQWAVDTARRKPIDYDFEMDFQNHDKLFCAEVIYAAYERVGISLWSGLSHISAAGTARWLEGLGVKNFVTLEPSDLEYDPQLVRVAEWRDPATLFEDHVHNAVTDVLLEGANHGNPLKINRLMLPVAWGLKAYSAMKNQFGGIGPIPKGMSSKAAMRSKWYSKQHAQMVSRVMTSVDTFKQSKGYAPPYWEIVRMAKKAQ